MQRRRTNDRVRRSLRRGKMAIPKAIKTRGTPGGYYEIPVQNRFITGTNKSGMLVTNQTDYTTSGSAYQGGAMWWTLSDVNQNFGSGGIVTSQGISVPGLASLQSVFDQCKVAYIDVEVRFNLAPREISNTTAFYNPTLYIVVDPDDGVPPTDLNSVLQYQKVYRVCCNDFYNKPVKIRVYPKVRLDIGATSDEGGSTTTLTGSTNAMYMDIDRPLGAMFGLKYWLDVPGTTSVTDMFGQIVWDIKQMRRYKISK